jgi:cytosine/uracil/thiamine/allantoin permease
MRQKGVDPRALSARIASMPTRERKKVWANYRLWIAEGANAQGWLGGIGAVAIGLSAFIPVIMVVNQLGSLPLYIS